MHLHSLLGLLCCSFAVAAEAEAARSALDDLQQAGFGIKEMATHFCEQFADVLLQQLMRPHLEALAHADFNLSEAQYSSMEACVPGLSVCLPAVCCTGTLRTWRSSVVHMVFHDALCVRTLLQRTCSPLCSVHACMLMLHC